MRSMMHATAFFLATVSVGQAQSPNTRTLLIPAGDRSVAAKSGEIQNGIEIEDPSAARNDTAGPCQAQQSAAVSFESGGTYSQLAAYMSCNDWSPNTWNNYASERAAIVRHISKHVDMQCGCFKCKESLHSHAFGPGCGECSTGTCATGCKPKLINRYKTPMSTLCNAPSDACGTGCEVTCSITGCATSTTGIATSRPYGRQTAQGYSGLETHPASSMRPVAPSTAPPHGDRVATPMIGNPRTALQIQNLQSRTQASR